MTDRYKTFRDKLVERQAILATMPEGRRLEFQRRVLDNKYIPCRPSPKQTEFLLAEEKEVFYGGAARGGKSFAMLMGALMYVDDPDYSVLILRKTLTDLMQPKALIRTANLWLSGTDAKYNGTTHIWTFPSGATMTFRYLENEGDEYNYKGTAFQYIAFDELTQFSEDAYSFLFRSLERKANSKIPLRIRSASNPGDKGHNWVKQRFIPPSKPMDPAKMDEYKLSLERYHEMMKSQSRRFIPARLEDNPYIDQKEYVDSLGRLDSVRREQQWHGDWDIAEEGGMFKRQKFKYIDAAPEGCKWVRYWDMASTEKTEKNKPCWTAGVLMGTKEGIFYIADIVRKQLNPTERDELQGGTAALDGRQVVIAEEEEGGSSGKSVSSYHSRGIFQGYTYNPIRSTGSKIDRARPFASAVNNGNVYLVRAEWNYEFISECEAFPMGADKDQVDAASGSFNALTEGMDYGMGGWM